MFRNAAMASSFAIMAFGAAGMATAQSNDNYKTLNDCVNQQNCGDQRPGNSAKQRSQKNQGYDQNKDQSGDMQIRKKPRQNGQSYNSGDQPGTMQMGKKRTAQNNSNWKYDSNRHERRRNQNSQFRFYFGGYYYPQPYWMGDYYGAQSYRVSCGEGRNIVDDNGYSRVRTIECGGGTFTYLGRRNGDTFKVFLNSRTGRIVGRQAV